MKWYLRQLFPLTYRSRYTDGDGRKHLAVWRMWFGQVFGHDDVVIAGE